MSSNVVRHLEARGPTPPDELPRAVEPRDRHIGVHAFRLSRAIAADPMGGRTTTIYYLAEHDRADVLRAFLDANPRLIEAKSRRALHRIISQQGRSWLEAAREVTGDDDDEYRDRAAEAGRQYQGETRTCDFCGEEVVKGQYPRHLAEECEEANR